MMAEFLIYVLVTLDSGAACMAKVEADGAGGVVITEIITPTEICQELAKGDGPESISDEDVTFISF